MALAADATLFYLLAGRLGIAGQYAVRAAAAATLLAVALSRRMAPAAAFGLSVSGWKADTLWLCRLAGILTVVAVVLMAAAVVALRLLQPPLTQWPLEWSQLTLAQWFLYSIILAPLVEETVYRGLMVPGLEEQYGPRGAVLAGSLLFYALHLLYSYPVYLVHYLVIGALLTWGFLRRRKLWICVLLHAAGNVLVVVDDALLRWWPEAFRAIVGRIPGP